MSIAIDFLDEIQTEIEDFDGKIISCLKSTSTDLFKKIEEVKKKVNEAQQVSNMWNEALKKRAEKKDSIHKEIKSAFIPCFLEKKTKMFHRCLVCLRKTEACVLQKKQAVTMVKIKEKLIKQQFDMINNEMKDAEKNFFQLKSEKEVCKNIKADKERIKKIFDKSAVIYAMYVEYKKGDLPKDFSTFFQKVEATKEWEGFNNNILMEEVEKFKQELEIFYNAKKRMDSDLDREFSAQVIERCRVLRSHDQQGLSFLNCLDQEVSSGSSKAVGKKMAYEKARDEYKKFISISENNYKKAIEDFTKISKSLESTCLERHCVKTYSCDDSKKGGCCDALGKEKDCYSSWGNVNKAKIDYQKSKFSKEGGAAGHAELYSNLNCDYDKLNNNEHSYNEQSRDHLDKWEASIPEIIWNNMLGYEESLYIIETMLSKIKEKENEIVKAIREWRESMYDTLQKKEEHAIYFIKHAQFVIKEQIAYAEKNKAERMKVCLRGEANTFVDQHLYWVIPGMIETRLSSLKEDDPYSIVNDLGESHLLFDNLLAIPDAERGKSNMCTCDFVPLCISKSYCFAKSDISCDGIGITCDDEPCYPQPPCSCSCCGHTGTNPSADREQK